MIKAFQWDLGRQVERLGWLTAASGIASALAGTLPPEDPASCGESAPDATTVSFGVSAGAQNLIGSGSVTLNRVVVGRGSIVAAGAVLAEGFVVPAGSLVAGVPATVKRSNVDTGWTEGAVRNYIATARHHRTGLRRLD